MKGNINSQFIVHPKCDKLNLSSLAFADDLFILSKADIESFKVIKETLEDFQTLSSLNLNLQKCDVFTSGISYQERTKIAQILGMPLGHLLIRYFGVALIARKLSYCDCRIFLDRLTIECKVGLIRIFRMEGKLR